MAVVLEDLILNALEAAFSQLAGLITGTLFPQSNDTLGIVKANQQLIESNYVTMISEFGATQTEIEQAIGLLNALAEKVGLLQSLQPGVALPPTPPAGYGGSAPSDVWSYILPFSGFQAGDMLDYAGIAATNYLNSQGITFPGQPWLVWIAHNGWSNVGTFLSPSALAPLDISTIHSGDSTPAAWVSRAYPSYGWAALNLGPNVQPLSYPDQSTVGIYWCLAMDQEVFDEIKASGGSSVALVAPVWPGAAKVTLGASTALADGMTVAGPLDGLIVKITAVPAPTGYYAFGARRSYVHVGGVVFVDDNGEAEHSQTIGLDDQVIVPRAMEHASSAIIRLKSGTVGTVQAWTVT